MTEKRELSPSQQLNINSSKKGLYRKLQALIELALFTAVYYIVWVAFFRGVSAFPYLGRGRIVLCGIYLVLSTIILSLTDSFKYGHRKFSDIFVSQVISMIIVNCITYFQLCLMSNRMINFLPIILIIAIDCLIALFCTFFFTAIYHKNYVPKDMIMVYGTDNALNLKFKMDTRSDKYHVSKVLSYKVGKEAIRKEIAKHDAVIVNDVPAKIRNNLLKYCYEHAIRTYVVPKVSDIVMRGAEEITLFDTPLLLVRGNGLSLSQRIGKRTLDIILSCIAMIPAAPIMGIVALCIKAEDHGPVFYRQARMTEGARVFNILKFRSMIVDAEKGGYDMSMRATGVDPRITKVGHVIRATRLDELPQIINILKGDMSIVGPRPERVENMQAYSEVIPEFMLRTKVKGGLTGYAQIYGKYNTSAYDKLRLDLMYIENYSLMLDIKLVFMTLQILFKKESTEGFDAKEELEKKKAELLAELKANYGEMD